MPTQPSRPIPVVVLGGGVTGTDVLRCLHLAGIPSLLVSDRRDFARYSRLPQRKLVIEETSPEAMLAELSAAVRGDAVLVPCSDRWARAVARLSDDEDTSGSRFRSSTPTPHAIDVLTDKLRFAKVLQAIGIPHPATRDVPDESVLQELPDALLRSSFLKPIDSQAFVQAFRCKAFALQGRAHARQMLARARAAGIPVMLQQFIDGPPQDHVFIDGFVDRSRTLNVVLARRRLRLQPPRFGNSSLTEVIPLEHADQPLKHLLRLFDALEFNGPFCAEFVFDPAAREHLLIEVNGRCWWQIGLTAACGANVPERIHADATGAPMERVEVDAVGTRWVYPLADVRSWSRAVLTGSDALGGVPPFAWRGGWRATTSWVDPLPGAMVWIDAAATATRRAREWVTSIGAVDQRRAR